MAEHLLDEADVRAALVHQRGHRVAEEMAGAGLAQLRRVDPLLDRELRWSRLNGSPCAVRNTVMSSGSTASCGRASRMYFSSHAIARSPMGT